MVIIVNDFDNNFYEITYPLDITPFGSTLDNVIWPYSNNLDFDMEVLVKPTLMNFEKMNIQFDQRGNVKGWTIKETWQVVRLPVSDVSVTGTERRSRDVERFARWRRELIHLGR